MAHRILIVEDEPLLAMHLEDILSDGGFNVVGIATHMADAMKFAANNVLDAAIVDIRLAQGDDGVEVARFLREFHNVPALFASGSLSEEVRSLALLWKPLGFISKPYTSEEIVLALKRLD